MSAGNFCGLSALLALLLSRHNNEAVRRRFEFIRAVNTLLLKRYEYNEPTEFLILFRLKWVAELLKNRVMNERNKYI